MPLGGYEFYLQTVWSTLSGTASWFNAYYHSRRLFTFSTSGEGAHSKWALSMGTGRLFLFEGRQNEKQSFDAYFTKDQKDLKTGLSLAQFFL